MRAATAVRSISRMSFTEFVETAGIRKYVREAFEQHVRGDGGFNLRTFDEWQRVKSEFLQQHRGRR